MNIVKQSITLALTIAINFLIPEAFSQNFLYKDGQKIVGKMSYITINENKIDLHTLAREYSVAYDSLIQANPHIEDVTSLEIGTVIFIPHVFIVPEIKPNQVTINIAEKRLYFYNEKQNRLYVYPVGVGSLNKQTPTGKMYITKKRYKPVWNVPKAYLDMAKELGYEDFPLRVSPGPVNPLGDYSVHLSALSYLIHSTHNPNFIGTRNTQGCVNLYPEDMDELFPMLKEKMFVTIINQPVKIITHKNKIIIEAHPFLPATTTEKENTNPTKVLQTLYIQNISQQELNNSQNSNFYLDKSDYLLQNPVGIPIGIQIKWTQF